MINMRNVNIVIKIIIVAVLLGGLIFSSGMWPISFLREKVVRSLVPLMKVTLILGDLTGAGDQFAAERIGKTESLTFEVEKLREANRALRKLFNFKEESLFSIRGARVLLYFKELGGEALMIDQGRNLGIEKGDFVIDENRLLVGVVAEVGDSVSKISIASNTGVALEVLVLPLGVSSLARGVGARTLSLDLIPVDVPLRRGDLVVLLGIANKTVGEYGAQSYSRFSFLLGSVVNNESSPGAVFREVKAVLLSRPEKLEEVFVVRRN